MSQLISILIPIYNIDRYVGRCIESCLSQTYTNIEIVCVNDGSTDDSLSIIERYAHADNRIKVVSTANQGLSLARYSGLMVSQGDYLFMLDGDDWIPAEAIGKMAQMASNYNSDIVVGKYYSVTENGDKVEMLGYLDFSQKAASEFQYEYVNRGPLCVWGKLFKRELFQNVRFYDNRITIGEDILIMLQLLPKSLIVSNCSFPVYYYFIRSSSIMNSSVYADKARPYVQELLWLQANGYSRNLIFPLLVNAQTLCVCENSKRSVISRVDLLQYLIDGTIWGVFRYSRDRFFSFFALLLPPILNVLGIRISQKLFLK